MVEVAQQQRSTRFTRRHFLIGSGAVAAGLTLYSGEVARHELSIVEREISLPTLPSAFQGLRVVQISDIHLDEFTEPFFLKRVVDHVNALSPDLVLLTGDFVTRGSLTFVAAQHAAHRCAEILSEVRCQERYAVLGNHDVTVGAALVTGALRGAGIPVLRNEFTSLVKGGESLWLCGTADPGTDVIDLDATLPPEKEGCVLLMVHAPDFADTLLEHPRGGSVSLMLSGHSHGGQIRLPVVGPLVLPPLGRKYIEGLYQLGGMQLYVNRGIGTVGLPLRLNCSPEITLFTLTSGRAAS